MAGPVKIAIIVEGGIVQGVLTAGVPVEYVVIDYDVDGGAGVQVPQPDGTTQDANPFGTYPADADDWGRSLVMWAHQK